MHVSEDFSVNERARLKHGYTSIIISTLSDFHGKPADELELIVEPRNRELHSGKIKIEEVYIDTHDVLRFFAILQGTEKALGASSLSLRKVLSSSKIG